MILAAVVAVAVSAPLDNVAPTTTPIAILARSENGPNPDGSFSWSYETANHISAQAQGELREIGQEHPALSVQGSYKYIDPADGQEYSVTYTADENGFQPHGAHLPTPPPIPEAIARALEWIARNAPAQKEQQQ